MKKIYLSLILLSTLYNANAISGLVISQVYGGGGNAGSTYTNDFIEIFNRSSSPIDLNGYSVQYASATGSTWLVTNLTNVMLQPGQYYLIQELAGVGGTTPLPTPDASGSIALSATAGKVALVNTTTALSGACPTVGVIDIIGYGGTANCFESAAAPAPSNTTADIRTLFGCSETDNNSVDFITGAPSPKNTSSTTVNCATLPLTLGSFKGTYSRSAGVSLTWTTLSEFNTDHFLVQRSTDGANWSALGRVIAAGNSAVEKTYSYSDVTIKSGKALYRLFQVDRDGRTKYSDVVNVVIGTDGVSFTLAPNPTKGITTIRSLNPTVEKVQVRVSDGSGRTVLRRVVSISVSNPYQLDLSALSDGQYFIETSTSSTTQIQKIIVQK